MLELKFFKVWFENLRLDLYSTDSFHINEQPEMHCGRIESDLQFSEPELLLVVRVDDHLQLGVPTHLLFGCGNDFTP